MHSTGERDVIEVVPGGLREWALLAPAGDPSIDEARIACETILGAEPEPLGHPWTKPFDQRVGALNQAQGKRLALRMFEVERQALPATQQEVIAQWAWHAEIAWLGAVDAQYGCAEIGEQHRAHRPRPDARQLHDFDTGQRSHQAPPRFAGLSLRGIQRRVKPPPPHREGATKCPDRLQGSVWSI